MINYTGVLRFEFMDDKEKINRIKNKSITKIRKIAIIKLIKSGVNTKKELGIELKKLGYYFDKEGNIQNPNVENGLNIGKLHKDLEELENRGVLEKIDPSALKLHYKLNLKSEDLLQEIFNII